MLVEERFKSCNEDKEESPVGKEERLRNVFGRETEMTLPWGEQVIPSHEHGVGLEGFQEESTDDLDLVKGSEAERRETRAWPSGEREVTSVLGLTMKLKQKQKVKKNEAFEVKKWTPLSIWAPEKTGLAVIVVKNINQEWD